MIVRWMLAVGLISIWASSAAAAENKKRPAVRPNVLKLYEAKSFEGMPYRLMKPIDLGEHPDKKYPLILSLHGAGGKGAGNIQNLRNWNGYLANETLRRKHPCFVVAPQSPGAWRLPRKETPMTPEQIEKLAPAWKKLHERRARRGSLPSGGNLDKVFKLLDTLAKEFNIDMNRVYVLGHSMGGFGTWTSLGEAPTRFAAAIPTAGGLLPKYDVKTFAHVPIWTFHGANDNVVLPDLTRDAFARLKAVNANIKYTELKGVGHGAANIGFLYKGDDPAKGYVTQYGSDQCDKTADIWDWLFAQVRQNAK